MLPHPEPRSRHAMLFLGSVWAAAIVFLIARAIVPG